MGPRHVSGARRLVRGCSCGFGAGVAGDVVVSSASFGLSRGNKAMNRALTADDKSEQRSPVIQQEEGRWVSVETER